jgi:NADH pyrophosphatase NudC (nudix superfamily)
VTRVLIVREEKFAVRDGRLVTLESHPHARRLGHRDGDLYVVEEAEVEHELLDFRAAAAVLAADDIALMSYAKGILNWQARANFCGACGSPLEARGEGHSRVCTGCGAEVFPRLDPAVMMRVTHDERILLAQHRGRGHLFWSTLAGFVEPRTGRRARAPRGDRTRRPRHSLLRLPALATPGVADGRLHDGRRIARADHR